MSSFVVLQVVEATMHDFHKESFSVIKPLPYLRKCPQTTLQYGVRTIHAHCYWQCSSSKVNVWCGLTHNQVITHTHKAIFSSWNWLWCQTLSWTCWKPTLRQLNTTVQSFSFMEFNLITHRLSMNTKWALSTAVDWKNG